MLFTVKVRLSQILGPCGKALADHFVPRTKQEENYRSRRQINFRVGTTSNNCATCARKMGTFIIEQQVAQLLEVVPT